MLRPGNPPIAQRRLTKVAAVSMVVLLAACGSSDPYKPTPKGPTAVKLAQTKGGVVSEFPSMEQGTAGDLRYCREIGGHASRIDSDSEEAGMTCSMNETKVTIEGGRDSSDVYRAMCDLASGNVVVVTVGNDTDVQIPACHIPDIVASN